MAIKNENFITIQGWMVNELKLKGNELIVYACIYGFSQTENQTFTGSISYLTEWLNVSRQTIINILTSLVNKGLITKFEKYINNVKYCEYTTQVCDNSEKSLLEGSQKILPGVVKNFDIGSQKILLGGSQKILPNNIYIDNNNYNIENAPQIKKHKYGEYKHVLLTDDEYQRLQQDYKDDLSFMIDKLDKYIEISGKKYKNHNLVLRGWVAKDIKNNSHNYKQNDINNLFKTIDEINI